MGIGEHKRGEKQRLEEKEADRLAFRNRMNYFNLTKTYNGMTKFPYETVDLARYMLDVIQEREINHALVDFHSEPEIAVKPQPKKVTREPGPIVGIKRLFFQKQDKQQVPFKFQKL